MSWWRRLFGGKTQRPAAAAQPPQPVAQVPLPADAAGYTALLTTALEAQNEAAIAQIRSAFALLPAKATGLDFGVHVDQDGEGRFHVMMHAGGPDLYVLNKALEGHREVFDSTHRPPDGLPLFDPDEAAFDVPDTITAAVERWLTAFWPEVDAPALPICVFQADDFAERPPLWLQGGPNR